MKQLSAVQGSLERAVQGSLERASRIVLPEPPGDLPAAAMVAGRTEEIVEELMEALRYDRIATGPAGELAVTHEQTS